MLVRSSVFTYLQQELDPFTGLTPNGQRNFRSSLHRRGQCSTIAFTALRLVSKWLFFCFLSPRPLLMGFPFEFLRANRSQRPISLDRFNIFFLNLGTYCYDDQGFGNLPFPFLFVSLFPSCLSLAPPTHSHLFLIYIIFFSTILWSTIKTINWNLQSYYMR